MPKQTQPKPAPVSKATSISAPSDSEAFRAAMRGVTPLQAVPHPPGLAARKPKNRTRRAAPVTDTVDELMPLLPDALPGSAPFADIGGEAQLSFQRGGVRTQVVRRLRRGLYPSDAELDLHGLSQTQARDRLAQFLADSRDAGCRCVRIIHGKGYRSGARGPVLKVAVDHWLRRHLDVMAFVSAKAIDGGTGALYVLLKA